MHITTLPPEILAKIGSYCYLDSEGAQREQSLINFVQTCKAFRDCKTAITTYIIKYVDEKNSISFTELQRIQKITKTLSQRESSFSCLKSLHFLDPSADDLQSSGNKFPKLTHLSVDSSLNQPLFGWELIESPSFLPGLKTCNLLEEQLLTVLKGANPHHYENVLTIANKRNLGLQNPSKFAQDALTVVATSGSLEKLSAFYSLAKKIELPLTKELIEHALIQAAHKRHLNLFIQLLEFSRTNGIQIGKPIFEKALEATGFRKQLQLFLDIVTLARNAGIQFSDDELAQYLGLNSD